MKIEGKMQSPIHIETNKVQIYDVHYDASIECQIHKTPRYVLEKDTTLSIALDGTSILNHREYNLVELHFHTPSEHHIDGKAYELEAHFVHRAQTGQTAVVAVMLTEGKFNDGFDAITRYLTDNHHHDMDCCEKLMPNNKGYYHYMGSLTTAPFTEGVEWYIFKEPVEVSWEQIQTYRRYYDNNVRPIQPLCQRVIVNYDESK